MKPTDTIWAVAVDDDCVPLTGMAHLMKYTETPPDEVESRTPICGQTFRVGWMQVPAGDGYIKLCLKCLKWAGKKAAGRLLDGRTWDELPEVMS